MGLDVKHTLSKKLEKLGHFGLATEVQLIEQRNKLLEDNKSKQQIKIVEQEQEIKKLQNLIQKIEYKLNNVQHCLNMAQDSVKSANDIIQDQTNKE